MTLLLLAPGAAAQDGERRDVLERSVLDALARGRDAAALLDEWRELAPASPAPAPPRSTLAADLGQALDGFLDRLPKSGTPTAAELDALLPAYDALRAADLAVREHFRNVETRLGEIGATGEIYGRLAAAEAAYLETADALFTLLEAPMDARRRRDAKAARDVLPALEAARALLDDKLRRPPRPVLGAGLPYRRPGLAARPPVLEPAVVPAYLDATAAPGGGDDLAATPEAPLADEILELAAGLGHDYVAIYEFVRNEIRTEWYAGSLKGALGTLRARAGNSVDQASLLIALARASRLPARYVHGVVEMPVAALGADLGLTEPARILDALARAGVAHAPVVRGGRVAAVRVEHTWVDVYVPYANYRGAVVDFSGKKWMPLAPAVKDVDRQAATAVLRAMGLDAAAFVDRFLAAPQPRDALATLRQEVETYLSRNAPGATYAEQLGGASVRAQRLRYLPSALPLAMNVVAVTGESPALADERRVTVRFLARAGADPTSPVVLDGTLPLAELAGARVTLSYVAATVDDHDVVNGFGGLSGVPLYLVRVRPQVKVGGRPRLVGEDSLETGVPHLVEIEVNGPAGSERVAKILTSGSYHALGLGAKLPRHVPADDDPADTEQQAARILSSVVLGFQEEWTAAEDELAGLLDIAVVRPLPSVAVAASASEVEFLFDLPFQLRFEGVTLDALLRAAEPVSRRGDAEAPRDWMRLAALQGSMLEHRIFERDFQVASISADKGLALARQGGVELLVIDSPGDPALARLAHPAAVVDAIDDALRLGGRVEVPVTTVTYNDWTGSAWRVEDPATGAAGYFISGGLAGGATSVATSKWVLDFLAAALAGPYEGEPNEDPLAGYEIVKLAFTDRQIGEVGEKLPLKLAALVRDVSGRQVKGVPVTFNVVRGGGKLAGGGSVATVPTNTRGIAAIEFQLGEVTQTDPFGLKLDPTDDKVTKALLNTVDARAPSRNGTLVLDSPFEAYGVPGPPVRIVRTDSDRLERFGPGGVAADVMTVEAQDRFGNSVSNVLVTFTTGQIDPHDECPPAPGAKPLHFFDADRDLQLSACPTQVPMIDECGSPVLTLETGPSGVDAGVIMGTHYGATYHARVAAAGLEPLTSIYRQHSGNSNFNCDNQLESHTIATGLYFWNDRNISATRVGEEYAPEVNITRFWGSRHTFPSFVWHRLWGNVIDPPPHLQEPPPPWWQRLAPPADVTLEREIRADDGRLLGFDPSGHASGLEMAPDGYGRPNLPPDPPANCPIPGSYRTRLRAGPDPGLYQLIVKPFTENLYIGQPAACEFFVIEESAAKTKDHGSGAQATATPGAIWALDLELRVATSPIDLDEHDRTTTPIRLEYAITPKAYQAAHVEAHLFRDDEFIDRFRGNSLSDTGEVVLPAGLVLDPARQYQVQLVLNNNWPVEVRSDKVDLFSQGRLIVRVDSSEGYAFGAGGTRSVLVTQELDVPNNRVCSTGTDFIFELAREARVTLKFFRAEGGDATGTPVFGSPVTLLRDVVYRAGENHFVITPSELPPGEYKFELTAVATEDPTLSDSFTGNAHSEFRVRDALPVGHTLVQGVDTFDGHLTLQRLDFELPGRGPMLKFERAYSSNATGEPGPLGAGWTHNYDARLVITPCGEVVLSGGDGSSGRFVPDGQGGFRPLNGFHGSLVKNLEDNSFDYFSKNGTRHHFRFLLGSQPLWVLDSIAETNGNRVKLTHVGDAREHRLLSAEDAAGRRLQFFYTRHDFLYFTADVITRIEGPGGLAMHFEYDGIGNLISARREDLLVERYGYRTLGAGALETRHLLTSVVNELTGMTAEYDYQQVSVGVQGQVLSVDVVTAATISDAGTTRFNFDTTGALASRGPPEVTTEVFDARGFKTTYVMNQYGSPLRIVDPLGNATRMTWAPNDVLMTSRTDANDVTTTLTYDEHGNLLTESVTVRDFDGRPTNLVKETTYHPPTAFNPPHVKERVATLKDRKGSVVRFSYDARGNLTEERITTTDAEGNRSDVVTRHTYASNSDRLSTTDANGNPTFFSYDAYGNLATVTDARGGVTTVNWDVRGRPESQIDALGRVTEIFYDALDRVVRRKLPDRSEALVVYDDAARTRTDVDAEGRATVTTFDTQGRPLRVDNAAAGARVFAYDPAGNKTLESTWFDATTPRFDTTFEYDDASRLVRRNEPLSRVTTFVYDAVGNVTRERLFDAGDNTFRARVTESTYDELNRRIEMRRELDDSTWAVTRFQHDGEGNKTLEVDPLGRRTSFRYDELNRLIETVEPEWKPGTPRVTRTFYDGNGNRVRTVLVNEPASQVRRFTYDELNRVITQTNAVGNTRTLEYDAVGNLVREIDALLNVTTHEYDVRDRRTKTTVHLDRVTNPRRNAFTAFAYDRVGNLVQETWPNGNVVVHRYDALNRLLETTDSLGPVASFAYDARGNRVRQTDAKGNATVNVYDALDRMVRQDLPELRTVSSRYDVAGNRTATTNARGFTTTFTYDALNRLATITDPAPFSHTQAFTYDLANNRLTETDRRGNTTSFEYDALDRRVRQIDPPPNDSTPAYTVEFTYDAADSQLTELDRRGTLTEFAYDAENRRIRTIRAGLVIERTQYDPNGNVLFATDANENVTGFEYDERNLLVAENRPLAAITRFTLDDMGDVVRRRSPEGRVTTSSYDVRRRVLTETIAAESARPETTTFAYDLNGNRTLMRRPEGNEWTYDYDAANRLVAVTDPLLAVTTYTWDKNGNLQTQTDANRNATTFSYDELDRPTRREYPDGAFETTAYDENGNVAERRDAKGQITTFTYDTLNRETLASFPADPATQDDLVSIARAYDENNNPLVVRETYSESGDHLTTRTYDAFDRLETVTDRWGNQIRYAYDANGSRTQLIDPSRIVTTYAYDALNRMSSVTTDAGVTQYTYSRDSRLNRILYPSGTTASHTYDVAGRTRVIDNRHNDALVSRFEYTYDTNGNRVQQLEEHSGLPQETTTYSYDLADRLLEVVYSDKTATYTYDAVGNRLTERELDATPSTITDKAYTYNNRNQLVQLDNILDPLQSITFTFDANGNQTRRSIASGGETGFVFDVRDQLVNVQNDSLLLESYSFDFQGLRVRKVGPAGIVRYTYDDQSVLVQTDDFGNRLAKYDYGPDRLLSLAHATDGRTYYLFDALRSTTNLLTPDGVVKARTLWDAWGRVRGGFDETANPFGFTGHEMDEETGLIYMKARFYDPKIGLFLSEDPFQGNLDLVPSLHRYLYTYQNPTTFIDPDGQRVFTPDHVAELSNRLQAERERLTELEIAKGKLLDRIINRDITGSEGFGLGQIATELQQTGSRIAKLESELRQGLEFLNRVQGVVESVDGPEAQRIALVDFLEKEENISRTRGFELLGEFFEPLPCVGEICRVLEAISESAGPPFRYIEALLLAELTLMGGELFLPELLPATLVEGVGPSVARESARASNRRPPIEPHHATTSPRSAQGVLNGIEARFLNPESRFGRAFYVAEEPGTAVAELLHHGARPTHAIRFTVNYDNVRILDPTDPIVAKQWGYSPGEITPQTQAIGARALEEGYNVIRYSSQRGSGSNLAILDDFNHILKPQMVVPIP